MAATSYRSFSRIIPISPQLRLSLLIWLDGGEDALLIVFILFSHALLFTSKKKKNGKHQPRPSKIFKDGLVEPPILTLGTTLSFMEDYC
jgi:hypothetical protein